MFRRFLFFSFAALLGPIGCSPADEKPPGVQIVGGNIPITSFRGVKSYPEGPYGRQNPEVGDVIENLQLTGYFGELDQEIRITSEVTETSFEEIRERGARYLLIHTSSAWCGTCRPEAFYLSQYKDRIMEEGGEVLELVIEGTSAELDPTKEVLDVWVQSNDLSLNTMIPNDDHVREVFPERDYVYIVELETMEVVWRQKGPSSDPTTTEIGALEMLSVWLAE